MPMFKIKVDRNRYLAVFFVHIPKCGGSAVEHFFKRCGFEGFLLPEEYRDVRALLRVPPAHYEISLLEQLFRLDQLYTFAIVRNPYDRFISHLQWARRKTKLENYLRKKSLPEYCEEILEIYKEDNRVFSNQIMPQNKFISSNVNEIFRIEDGLESAVSKVFSDLGVTGYSGQKLPIINGSANEFVRLDKKSKRLLSEFYKDDFQLFGYKK